MPDRTRQARERAETWLADTEAGGVSDRSFTAQIARDVLALAARVDTLEAALKRARRFAGDVHLWTVRPGEPVAADWAAVAAEADHVRQQIRAALADAEPKEPR